MGILKRLFGSKNEDETVKKQTTDAAGHADSVENENEETATETASSKDFDILKYDGVRALRTGQWQQAIDCLQFALGIQEDAECRDYLSQALLHHDEPQAAREQMEKLCTMVPDNALLYLRMAQADFIAEDYERMDDDSNKALSVVEKATGEQADTHVLAQAYYYKARAAMGLGRDEDAVSLLEKATATQSDFAEAYLTHAGMMLKHGDTDKAEADAQRLTTLLGESEETLLLTARIHGARGENDKALEDYDKVVALNPFSTDALRERAALRQQAGDEAGAAEDLSALHEIAPENDDENIEQKMNETYRNANPYGF